MTESYGAGVDLAVAEPVLTTPAARVSAASAASAAADCAFAAAMVDAAIGDLDLVLDLDLDTAGSALPEVLEQPSAERAEISPLVSSLVQAYARRRGMPVGAVMLAYPLHDVRVVERLVADLARAQGTSEAVVRLTFGQPTPR